MQNALKKSKTTTCFKLTLLNMENELKVAVWASRTPEQFVLHVCSTIHVRKQMGLDSNFADAKKGFEIVVLNTKLMKGEFLQACNSKQGRHKGNKGRESNATPTDLEVAKANHKNTTKALEAAKLAVTMTRG